MMRLIRERFLRASIFYKVLWANSLIVVVGAIVGTWLTAERVKAEPGASPLELVASFAVAGIALSLVVNFLVLKVALRPLEALEGTARRVQQGELSARFEKLLLGDPHTDRLAETFNSMLDRLEGNLRAIERYSEQLQARSGQVISAQEEERKRIARELHDETGQALTSLSLGLKMMQGVKRLSEAKAQAEELLELTHQAMDGVHRLAMELRPKTLDDLGLVPALRWYANEWARSLNLAVDFQTQGIKDRLPPPVEIVLYRVIQEALTNVAKHASARRVRIRLEQAEGHILASVEDDGQGFDVRALLHSGDRARGLGLFGMQERMSLVGGSFAIESAPGQGTVVRVEAPLEGLRPEGEA